MAKIKRKENEDMGFEELLNKCWAGEYIESRSPHKSHKGKAVPTYIVRAGGKRLELWSFRVPTKFDVEKALQKVSEKMIKGQTEGKMKVGLFSEVCWMLIE